MDFMEFDKIVPLRNPSCRTVRRVRSSREMPHSSDSASGESATINNDEIEGSDMLGVESVLRSFVIHNTEIAAPNQWIHELPDTWIISTLLQALSKVASQ